MGGKNSRTLVINFPALTFFPQKVLKVSLIAFIQSEHQRIIKHFYSARVAIFIELSTPKDNQILGAEVIISQDLDQSILFSSDAFTV